MVEYTLGACILYYRAIHQSRSTNNALMARGLFRGTVVQLLIIGVPALAGAQSWNDARTRALVAQATERRARQLADTGLTDYSATAHGYLTFLAQLGEGFPDPPKVVKADEIALEVYWRSPNYSKQWIVGRRDTLVLPTDIQYHRDHLGIVQNNFPQIIRVGEGDEVRDVPHPLSAIGMASYDFAISDSLHIEIPGRTIDVYELKLRPRNQSSAAAVGALYLAREDAQVVRMAFSFTRAALIDKELEDVSIVLENSLIEGRFWLPRRQEIEIRRTGTWMDFPARGIIRGRWEICCYRVNQGHPVELFAGPEIVLAPPGRRRTARWPGAILDSLPPEVRAPTDEEVRRIQSEARELVRASALARARSTSLAMPSLSDVVRVSRAEGLSLGAGFRRRLAGGFDAEVRTRFGFADHEPKGSASIGRRGGEAGGMLLRGFREYRDVADEVEASGARNSIAAQEFGSDYSEPIDARGGELLWESRARSALLGGRWRATLSYEWQDSARLAARPSLGTYEPTLPARRGYGPRVTIEFARPMPQSLGGFQGRFQGRVRAGRLSSSDSSDRATFARLSGSIELNRSLGQGRIMLRAVGGAVSGEGPIPAQDNLFAGGPVTAPGYSFHSFVGERLVSLRGDVQIPVPFVPVPLGRWGRIPGRASVVPLASVTYLAKSAEFRPQSSGWYPSVGLGLLAFFELVRFDVARGTRNGRWMFNVDLSRDFWRIM
jgi:hypothetical protein